MTGYELHQSRYDEDGQRYGDQFSGNRFMPLLQQVPGPDSGHKQRTGNPAGYYGMDKSNDR